MSFRHTVRTWWVVAPPSGSSAQTPHTDEWSHVSEVAKKVTTPIAPHSLSEGRYPLLSVARLSPAAGGWAIIWRIWINVRCGLIAWSLTDGGPVTLLHRRSL